jgi:8-oxo-dGTP diphosphatase
LQELYEAILGIDLDRRNFRKKIALKNWLIDLEEMENNVPHRPGKLYKVKTGYGKKQVKNKKINSSRILSGA